MELFTSNNKTIITPKMNNLSTSTINFNDLLVNEEDTGNEKSKHGEKSTKEDVKKLTERTNVNTKINCKRKNMAVVAERKTLIPTKKKCINTHSASKLPEDKIGDRSTISVHENIEDHCCGNSSGKMPNSTDCSLSGQKFHCGMCQRNFKTICCLHLHLVTNHHSGGSYSYDEIVKTAYPKYESFCRFTQTEEDFFGRNDVCDQHVSVFEKGIEVMDKTFNLPEVGDDSTHLQTSAVTLSESDNETIAWEGSVKEHEDLESSIGQIDALSDEVSKKEMTLSLDCIYPSNDKMVRKPEAKKNLKRRCGKITVANVDSGIKILKRLKGVKKVTKLKKLDGKFMLVKGLKESGSGCVASETSSLSDRVVAGNESGSDKKCISCNLCHVTFTRKESLIRHEKAQHSGQQKHKCQDCDKKFMRKSDLSKHKCKAPSVTIKALQGKKKRTRDGSVNISSVEKSPVSCVAIKNEPKHDENLEDDEFGKNKTLTENECDQLNKNSEAFELEKLKFSNRSSGPKEEYVKTTKRVKSKAEILQDKLPYTCELCGHIMPRAKMEIHQRLHTGERPFVCSTCGKGLISADKLKRHMLTHSETRRHKCEVCGAGFMMKYKLQMHMHIHTGKKPYLCSICGADFNHSSNLTNHIRCVHKQVKPFTCAVCGFKFARKSQLDEHEFSHSSEKQFTCRFCGKSFKYPKGLKRHEKSHMNPLVRHECNQCDMSFLRRDVLTKHRQTHKQDTPELVCNVCKAVLTSHDEFTEHVRSHNEKQSYQCVICKEKFTVANRYYTHMDVIHNVKNDTAKLMLTDCKDGKMSKKVADILAKNPTKMLDPNLPLPADSEENGNISDPQKLAENGNGTYNINHVVSSIIDENKATLNALTRAATENLRLHSQDISEEEQTPMLTPPLNSLSVYEKSARQAPIDHVTPILPYNIGLKFNLQVPSSTHSLDNPDHAYVQSLNQNQSTVMNRLGYPVATSLNSSINSTPAQLHGIDSLGYSSSNPAMLHIGHFPPFLTGAGTSVAVNSIPHGSQPSSLISSLEHSAIESLSHLQDSGPVPVSGTLVPSSQETLLLEGNQSAMLMTSGIVSNEGTTDQQRRNFRIQNLF